MNDIEKLKAAQAEALNTAIEENRIFHELPIPPKRVSLVSKASPWVTYEVDNLEEALDIFKAYTPEPWVIARDGGCTILHTWEYIDTHYNKKRASHTSAWRPYEVRQSIADGAPYFACEQGVGFGGTEMEFFTKAAGTALKIIIAIKYCPIRVNLITMNPSGHRGRREYRKDYPQVPGAQVVKWGYGDDCAKGTYWFADLTAFWAAMGTYVNPEGLPE